MVLEKWKNVKYQKRRSGNRKVNDWQRGRKRDIQYADLLSEQVSKTDKGEKVIPDIFGYK